MFNAGSNKAFIFANILFVTVCIYYFINNSFIKLFTSEYITLLNDIILSSFIEAMLLNQDRMCNQ